MYINILTLFLALSFLFVLVLSLLLQYYSIRMLRKSYYNFLLHPPIHPFLPLLSTVLACFIFL